MNWMRWYTINTDQKIYPKKCVHIFRAMQNVKGKRKMRKFNLTFLFFAIYLFCILQFEFLIYWKLLLKFLGLCHFCHKGNGYEVFWGVCNLAERVGFEPTWEFPPKSISSRPRYDHFGTSPHFISDIFEKIPLKDF